MLQTCPQSLILFCVFVFSASACSHSCAHRMCKSHNFFHLLPYFIANVLIYMSILKHKAPTTHSQYSITHEPSPPPPSAAGCTGERGELYKCVMVDGVYRPYTYIISNGWVHSDININIVYKNLYPRMALHSASARTHIIIGRPKMGICMVENIKPHVTFHLNPFPILFYWIIYFIIWRNECCM